MWQFCNLLGIGVSAKRAGISFHTLSVTGRLRGNCRGVTVRELCNLLGIGVAANRTGISLYPLSITGRLRGNCRSIVVNMIVTFAANSVHISTSLCSGGIIRLCTVIGMGTVFIRSIIISMCTLA